MKELQVLIALLKGYHAGETAEHLGLKQTTIESYLANIKNKTGTTTINLWNCYGPTEATFGMSMLCVSNLNMENNTVPIGKPVLPVKAHIIEGEMYIESPFLPPYGYICAEKSTNEKAFPTLIIDGEQKRVFRPGDKFHSLSNDLLAFERP